MHVCTPRNGEAVFALMGEIRNKVGYNTPISFKTDGASIPRIARAIAGKFGHGLAPAIRHDWRYFEQNMPRKEADQEYKEGLLDDPDVANWRAHSYYRLLRMFGWAAWNANQHRPISYFFCEDIYHHH